MGKAHSNAWRNVRRLPPRVPAGAPAGAGRAGRRRPSRRPPDRYGWAESATDWRAVIERDDIDVVDICTPGHLHADIALAALEAGKHVLVEKPLANTLAEAEEMVAAADAAARARRARRWSASTTAGCRPWRWPAS